MPRKATKRRQPTPRRKVKVAAIRNPFKWRIPRDAYVRGWDIPYA